MKIYGHLFCLKNYRQANISLFVNCLLMLACNITKTYNNIDGRQLVVKKVNFCSPLDGDTSNILLQI